MRSDKNEKGMTALMHQRDEAMDSLKKQTEQARRQFNASVHPSDDRNAHIASTIMAAALGGVLVYMSMHEGKKKAKPKTTLAKIKTMLADTAQDLGAMIDWDKVAAQAAGLLSGAMTRKSGRRNGRAH